MSEALLEFWATWYQPLIGALHVLGIAWFGGTLFSNAHLMRRVGLVWMLATGLALLAANYAHVIHSTAFFAKIALLAGLVFVRGPRWLVIGLWVAVIFASRAIAYV